MQVLFVAAFKIGLLENTCEEEEKTTFITPEGLYQFNVVPFGLRNAPVIFESIINNVLQGLKRRMCLC